MEVLYGLKSGTYISGHVFKIKNAFNDDFSAKATAAKSALKLRDWQKILKVVQDFDPPGIFARNLSECLSLQLKDLDRYDPIMEEFLKNSQT